jgi:hypothetical protein
MAPESHSAPPYGLTPTSKMSFFGIEGLLVCLALMILPFLILYVLFKVLPPWDDVRTDAPPHLRCRNRRFTRATPMPRKP